MTITATLVQDSFTSAHFSVVSGVNADYTKYDIRVVPISQSTIGADGSAADTKIYDFTLTAVPMRFNIPTTSSMQSGLYKATMRLYVDSVIEDTAVGVFYYDTRTFTVDPIQIVSNNSSNVVHRFSHSAPVVKVGGVALSSSDAFYSYVKLDSVNLSCTNVEPSGAAFAADVEFNLGEQTYVSGTTHVWPLADAHPEPLPSDAAYECWGYISLDNSDTVVAMDANYIKPSHSFVFDFVADDTTVGYHLALPEVTLALGDVVGTVSDNPITLTLSNIAEYADYPFDSIELKIRETSDVTTAVLFTLTKTFSDFDAGVVNFEASEIAGYVNGADTTDPVVNLVNGTPYYFETVLKFTDADLFTPAQQRSVVTSGEFNDRILPITTANVVNSWTLDPTQGDGLVVSFKKTEQFMGTSAASYNLDANGVTTVFAEYSVLDSAGATTTWLPLSGGSIAQGSVTYALDAANTTGIYTVPKNITSASLGPAQAAVNIYAKIPGQANCNLVAVRLTLTTNNAEFSPTQRTSNVHQVAKPTGYTYPFTASIRYLPKPEDHDFTTDKPFIQIAETESFNNISFNVPVSAPRFFRSVVTTGGAGTVSGTATTVGNNDAAYSGNVTGLSYVPTADQTFALTVAYKYSENNAVTTTQQSMTVQMQGFPIPTDKGFTITSASWNRNTQKLDYVINVSATATSAARVDGWNLYTKLASEDDSEYVNHGNVLKSAGLTQSLALSYPDYPEYSVINVRVVATRSKYLSSTETTAQNETNTDDIDDAGIQTTQITILPTELPKPTQNDITLSKPIYDTNVGGIQFAEVSVGKGSNVHSIKLIDVNNTADETIKTTNPSVFQIQISDTEMTKQFQVSYGYQSYSSSGSSIWFSDSTILEFITGVNNSTAPLILSKEFVSATEFGIAYTGGSTAGSSNSSDISLASTIIGGSNDETNFGPNDGIINVSLYKDTNMKVRVKNTFSSSYMVDTVSKPVEQTINGPESAVFRVAANPSIVSSSIVVRPTLNTITFDVRNNGDPYMDTALVIFAQDPSSNDGDKGTFGMALFQNSAGFQVGVSQTNVFRGGLVNGVPTTAAHTLTAAITGTGYDKVTTFTFQSATVLTTTHANVVLYVANAIEGSDSLVKADIETTVTPVISPTGVIFAGNGGLLTFFADGHPFQEGDIIVFFGATGNLAPLNGTYTVIHSWPEQFEVTGPSDVPEIYTTTPTGTITSA